jgi:phage baseplate assembly protein W
MQIAFPLQIERAGQIATAGDDDHVRQMIEQVLFTNPGERVNRPDFGCGIYGMIFEPANGEMLAVTQALVRGNLVKWLGDVIHLEDLDVEARDEDLVITITYVVLRTLQRATASFRR